MICNNILEAMGNTPMIRLNHMTGPEDAEILVKFEGLNVGGSIKTRTAYNMILDAEKQGKINKDTIIVDIGMLPCCEDKNKRKNQKLAQICKLFVNKKKCIAIQNIV